MKDYRRKWTMHKVMEKEDQLSPHLPETCLLTEETLWDMLGRHAEVMVKPCLGAYGRGIIQVTAMEDGSFLIHDVVKEITFPDREQTFKYITGKNPDNRPYLVQQKVHLARIDDAPFDMRVMVQRRKGSLRWNITGKLCKVAVKKFVITNVAKELLTVEEAVARSSVCDMDLQALFIEIDRVSLLAAQTLRKHYRKQRTFGLDIGIDRNGRIWVIEANLRPVLTPFARLKDTSMLQTILSYNIINPRLPPSFKPYIPNNKVKSTAGKMIQ